jgi:hypothetical protein
MQFAKIIFRIAGVWGFLILLPMYFLLDKLSEQNPPAVTHSEFYYGFVGLALVWQIAFFIIATDPVRFRPIVLAAIPEKFIFVVTVLILARHQAVSSGQWIGVAADFLLGILFVIAYFRTPRTA